MYDAADEKRANMDPFMCVCGFAKIVQRCKQAMRASQETNKQSKQIRERQEEPD